MSDDYSEKSDELNMLLETCYKECDEIRQALKRRKEENPTHEEISRDLYVITGLAVLYRVSLKNRKAFQAVNRAIQELPDRQEFESLKIAMQSALNEQDKKTADTEQKVVETLHPINEMLKELQKLKESKPFGDMYG